MIRSLNEVCQSFEYSLTILDEISKTLQFEEVCEFSLKDFKTSSDSSIRTSIYFNRFKNCKGLYLFEIKRDSTPYQEWIINFENRFHHFEGEKDFFRYKFTPKVIKNRIKIHKDRNPEWIPLYLGKSENIKRRLDEHIFSELGKPPFSLKLYSRFEKNVFSKETFRLKIIKLDLKKKHYDLIAPYFEKKLRQEISPIVGKQ